ncbi:MAG TPA: chalcone isomerase family protein [Limnobacter sp.]|uniref:chalcone isomerase family protein n=1 Tax=Limnobacter sp. TaxID=2003368 RepID=UPI002E359913|nr:chalcone isomerase family protein [Limnobacter sp.]HEX5486196.1 chalcone isomerase family protein [Limnobacter sp.]
MRVFLRSLAFCVALPLLGFMNGTASASEATNPPPQEVMQAIPGAHRLGGGTYTWFALHVYDAQLWSSADSKSFDYARDPSWLELKYARDFKGAKIASKSRDEIEDMRPDLKDKTLDGWEKQMADIFPNVKEGQTLSALYQPGKGIQFFKDGKPIAALKDEALSKAFMAIWLDPKTSDPDFRRKLIGLSN